LDPIIQMDEMAASAPAVPAGTAASRVDRDCGDFIYEPPGESHALVAYDSGQPMHVFFVVQGPLIWLDESGNGASQYDVFDYIAAARAHYDEVGIGPEYVDSLVR
jgi:2,4'-dihydroxyacetophenone dioxygenase